MGNTVGNVKTWTDEAAENANWGWGGNGADLFSLELESDSIKVVKIATKDLRCKYKCGWACRNTECNMAAAGGAYVGKDGKLIIYGVEHDNDGPKVGGEGSVKMMELAEK